MSRNVGAEEDWEDVGAVEEEEEEEEDTTINNSDVVMRYKKAALWCNETLQVLLDAAKPGAKVYDLCRLGDETIAKKLKTMFKGTEKGIAFPTCVSVNSCVAHNSPSADDEAASQEIQLGDVVHFDLGVHVDGYCAQVAHTVQVTENNELAADAKATKVISAAHSILNTAMRKLRPGTNVYDVTEIIEKAAAHYGVTPVDGVLSHMLKRYIVDSFRCIPQRKVAEHLVHDYTLEAGQVWALDIVVSSGKGKLKERDARPTIHKVALDSKYAMKMESARELQREIEAKYQTFPFALRNLETKRARLGLTEMVKHDAVVPYPVLYERDGEVVGHFKATVLITGKKIEPVTGLRPQKAPALPAYTDELLLTTSKLPLSLEEKKRKN
ncbi:putative aminopeptidase, putative,metallo-peptidase, Clan MG, Family M24 [Trypanosoma conorhini]|uniref:Putative aminopeptidase, putative,metallo-peptidase, Clan MG, Family M24 n=1 Tax=Trypanosoma conorhini TaxID=83891 RepID=A0A3R7L156_9TRYP|nr:putative aminopeptidase, putative,metallo-peptidase, Clan MG, Family M24 [Trypanosoma conorhini]RNF19026.1 putative aminopeptidase, putative,metallo-peptidase, Clan MG, Family M24 [Trypanosoma conorhini]